MTWVRHVILGYNHNFIFGSWFILGWKEQRIYSGNPGTWESGCMAWPLRPYVWATPWTLSSLLAPPSSPTFSLWTCTSVTEGSTPRGFSGSSSSTIYINRYLWFASPCLALSINFFVGISPLLITKPHRAYTGTENCKEIWWRHLLLFFNIWGRQDGGRDTCVGQTWYLAFDTEWFLVSSLVVYPLEFRNHRSPQCEWFFVKFVPRMLLTRRTQ